MEMSPHKIAAFFSSLVGIEFVDRYLRLQRGVLYIYRP